MALQDMGSFPPRRQVDDALLMGDTSGMKTAISLPEKVFMEAERFARRQNTSRSQLYSEAIAEYLARHSTNEVTHTMNQVCDRLGTANDKFQIKAAHQLLTSESW